MNTPTSNAETSVDVLEMAKGENQSSSGFDEAAGAVPSYTLYSATPAKRRSAPTWRTINTSWIAPVSSVPMMQIAVITTMYATARVITAGFEAAADSQPTSSYV